MLKRLTAMALIISFLVTAVPVCALAEVEMPIESGCVDPIVPPAEGETGAEGISVEGFDAPLPESIPENAGNEELPVQQVSFSIRAMEAAFDDDGFAVNTGVLSMTVGSSFLLQAVAEDGTVYTAAWSSSNESVASVRSDGHVTALEYGETVITAALENGQTASCTVRVGRVAEDISFSGETIYIGVGETVDPGVVLGDGEKGYFDGYSIASDKSKYVRVNADGTITGRKKGSAVITVTTENNVTGSVRVVVRKAPEKITASPSKITLGLHEQAYPGYKLSSGSSGRVTYKSLNEECVAVNAQTGQMTAKSTGTAKVRITTYNGKKCTVEVKVVSAPENIILSDNSLRLGVGQTAKLKASIDRGASHITWKSDNPQVASVENGKITAIAPGMARIAACTHVEGVYAECTVVVTPAPEDIVFPFEKVYIGVGEKLQLEPDTGDCEGGFTYSSSKEKYVSVSASGLVKGKKKGSATVTVKTYNGKKAAVKVVVGKAPEKITAESMVLGVGEQRKLAYRLSSGSYGSVEFESLTPEIVSVDRHGGAVQALAVGEAQVRIKAYNDAECTVNITVANAPKQVTVTPYEVFLRVGESAELTASVNEGAASALRWESSDNSVVITEDGKLNAVGVGTACVRAKSFFDGVYGECIVHVTAAPEPLVVSVNKLQLGVGETYMLDVSGGEPEGNYVFAVNKSKYASVSEDGEIRAKAEGKAVVTVTSADGQQVQVPVTVGKRPSKVTASAKNITIGLGETTQIGYKLPKGSYGSATFECVSGDCVIVDRDTGMITGSALGTAEIEIETYNGKTAKTIVTVLNTPESVVLSDTYEALGVGQKFKLSAAVNEGAASAITWKSSDDGVAAVENGSVRAIAPGSAEICAMTYAEGVQASCTVVVKPAPEKVVLPEKKIYIGVGDSVRIEPDVGDSVGGYTYSSGNKKIAAVKPDGTVKGIRSGTTKITVKTYNGKKAAVTVVVRKAPGMITPKYDVIRLGVGDSRQLEYVLPAKTAGTVTFSTEHKDILHVDSDTGFITGLSEGWADVIMRTHNGSEASCRVEVCPAPEWIEAAEQTITLGIGQEYGIATRISEGSLSSIRYSASPEGIVAVSEDGLVTAVSKGEADILIETCNPEAWTSVHVNVLEAPSWVRFDIVERDMSVDESFSLAPIIPDGSHTQFAFTSSDSKLAEVSPDGVVHTRMKGNVFITAETHNGMRASVKLNIFDPWYPESIELLNKPGVLWENCEPYALEYRLTPENARPLMVWTSSDERVATVDQNGVITPLSYGYTTIKGVSEKNSDVCISFTLAVQEKDRILVIPERITDEAGIEENLGKIDDIRASAIAQVNTLRAAGKIKASDASKRRTMINNIFKDYAFPWKTTSLQKYWKSANSEGGRKHFRPDRIYYGMPYISGSGANRAYTAAKAVKEGRYTDSGNGYYVLNKKKHLNGKYVGSDCSGLVNNAIWGTGSVHRFDRTVEIAESKSYKTIKSFNSLRPGDLICLGYGHVVMFLYYADQEKSRIMIIENGGAEPGTNTVHCAVYNVSYYKKRGYKVRRLASLG